MNQMKASEWIIEFLDRSGVRFVFEVAGGMIAHLLDALSRQSSVQVVSMHHEQAAAFAAEGVARMTGVPGVAMATSGPGATNLLTAVGSMYFDSYPAVFITGQVNRDELKGERRIRQLGFQELDIVSMARPITKAARAIDCAEVLPAAMQEAFGTAAEGRPGPVLLDIPMDVQRQGVAAPALGWADQGPQAKKSTSGSIDTMLNGLATAERPLLLAGGGLRSAQMASAFRVLARSLDVPVVHSLQAVDVLEFDDPLRVGMIGSYGNRWANYALGRCDYLLVLGSRLDVRQTGADISAFKENKTIIHVDCEPGEINNRVTGCEGIVEDLRSFVPMMLKAVGDRPSRSWTDWRADIDEHRHRWPDTDELADAPGINPNRFVHALSKRSRGAAAWVVDVGQHQMWAAQSVELGPDQRFLTSGGMGAMGFALPAAIGAALVATPRPVVCVSGDGGLQMNIQELETVSRLSLPLKVVVIDNGSLGMVRQFQADYFDGRFQSTLWGYGAPDFCRLAEAYGIKARDVVDESDLSEALAWLWNDAAQPALLRVKIDQGTNAYPKMTFGNPITKMFPPRTA
jgi:acetolactate synthase-1/2/3 large subunit